MPRSYHVCRRCRFHCATQRNATHRNATQHHHTKHNTSTEDADVMGQWHTIMERVCMGHAHQHSFKCPHTPTTPNHNESQRIQPTPHPQANPTPDQAPPHSATTPPHSTPLYHHRPHSLHVQHACRGNFLPTPRHGHRIWHEVVLQALRDDVPRCRVWCVLAAAMLADGGDGTEELVPRRDEAAVSST